MTKKPNFFITIVCLICLTVTMNRVNAQTWPPHFDMVGDGLSETTAWEITTITDLTDLAKYVNAGNGSQTAGIYYKLMNDITYIYPTANKGWDPIGNNRVSDAIFRGNFDGNGKKVSDLMIRRGKNLCVGLFGYVSSAYIHDLGIEIIDEANLAITANQYVGGLIGVAEYSIIENCHVIGKVEGNNAVGGLVGMNYFSTISNSYAISDVRGTLMNGSAFSILGGFIGYNNGTITTSYASGNVSAAGSDAGGFAGQNDGFISNCYATGDVTGDAGFTGGFLGTNKEDGILTYCYATGNVNTTKDYIGGLVGANTSAIRNCVAANNIITGGISNVNRVAGRSTGTLSNMSNNYAYDGMLVNDVTVSGGTHNNVNGENKSMSMLTSFNFYNTGGNWYSNIPWSIATNNNPLISWKICDGETLPFLQWEKIDCVILPPDTCFFYAFGGDGSQEAPYQIYYPCQLADLAAFVNQGNAVQTIGKYFMLMNDIDLTDYSYGEGWEPIGYINIPNGHYWFQGNFDGNGKIVTNLIINRSSDVLIGLFGGIVQAAINNIGIEDCQINGNSCVGGLVGAIDGNSTITNCYVTGNVTGGNHAVGGLIGGVDSYTVPYANSIKSCYAACTVSATYNQYGIGGLVGVMYENCTISDSYTTGSATGHNSIGGLVGDLNFVNNTAIFYSYTESEVKGNGFVGGLAGRNAGATIRNCVATNPSVSGNGSVNRIIGANNSGGLLSNNYANEDMLVNGLIIIGGTHNNVNGENKPMDTLMSFNFYNIGTNWYNSTPWDIDLTPNSNKIWGICDGKTLPFFQWQGFNCSKKIPQTVNYEDDYPLERNRMSKFSIYPNPTSGNITISSENHFHTVEIVDLLGKVIHVQPNNGNNITLNISGYSNGIYFVRIITENGIEVQKFVKN